MRVWCRHVPNFSHAYEAEGGEKSTAIIKMNMRSEVTEFIDSDVQGSMLYILLGVLDVPDTRIDSECKSELQEF